MDIELHFDILGISEFLDMIRIVYSQRPHSFTDEYFQMRPLFHNDLITNEQRVWSVETETE